MEELLTFLIAFFFSFIGTIPPGSLNLTIIQLGLDHHIATAWRFAFAGAMIEYIYAWIAVEFESLITSSPLITENFQLITAVVMITLGVFNLWTSPRPSSLATRLKTSGFRRGLVLGILNPMALPFWVAMTAYIKSQGWVDLSSRLELHSYLLGVALGGLALMMILAYLAKRVVSQFQENKLLKKIPGIAMLVLGTYAIIQYFF